MSRIRMATSSASTVARPQANNRVARDGLPSVCRA
jgi:hypothetical protein